MAQAGVTVQDPRPKASTEAAAPFEQAREPVPLCKLDQILFAELKRKGLKPARPCSDAVFLRRAILDAAGTLPTAAEARSFLADKAPDKRARLVDGLLAREEFVDFWTLRWCDALRVKAEFPINLWPNAVQAYHRWVREAVRADMPYDRMARALLTASGSNFRNGSVNFFRAVQSKDPASIARAVALTFMGCRTDRWPRARLDGMALFFSQIAFKHTLEWKEEVIVWDQAKALVPKAPRSAVLPDGSRVALSAERDPRFAFADWLTKPGNPWFAAAAANRVWFWLMGRGIIHEPDDMRPDNPPSCPALLAQLQRELASGKYGLRSLIRTIMNSAAYQLSSIPRSTGPAAEALFAAYPVRRLEAEALVDAINQVTGTTETYSSPIPEPFTFIPESKRSIALADGSTSSAFLELFGRPARDTGMALERSGKPTAGQSLHLLNSSHIMQKLERGPEMQQLYIEARNTADGIERLYLTLLSRLPTDAERAAAQSYAGPSLTKAELVDLAWALINGPEFLCKH